MKDNINQKNQTSMTKPLKPGQLCMIDDRLYRAKARTCGCEGCSFDFITCPNAYVANERRTQKVDCTTHWVILVKQ